MEQEISLKLRYLSAQELNVRIALNYFNSKSKNKKSKNLIRKEKILEKEQIPNHVIPAFENLKTQSSRYLERANGILNMICGLY